MYNDKPSMKVSLDGGVTYQDVTDGVRIIYSDVPIVVSDSNTDGELHINLTEESMVVDLWFTRVDYPELIGTRVNTIEDLTPEQQ